MTTTSSVTTIITILVLVLIHTADRGAAINCGIPNQYPGFKYDVDCVLNGLVANTSPDNPSYLYYPDGTTVGTALGKAECHSGYSYADCYQCLQMAKDGLIDCRYNTYGQYDDGACSMQYWQITG